MPQDLTLSPDLHPRLLCCLQALKLIRKLLSHDVQVSFKYNLFAVCTFEVCGDAAEVREGFPLSSKSSSGSENSPEVSDFYRSVLRTFKNLCLYLSDVLNMLIFHFLFFVLLVPTDLL